MAPRGMLLGVPIGALAKRQLHLIRLVDPVNRELTHGSHATGNSVKTGEFTNISPDWEKVGNLVNYH